MRVYWGMALTKDFSDIYHQARTLPLGRSGKAKNTGWDMPEENFNDDLKADLGHNWDWDTIDTYADEYPFTKVVSEGLRDITEQYQGEAKDQARRPVVCYTLLPYLKFRSISIPVTGRRRICALTSRRSKSYSATRLAKITLRPHALMRIVALA